MIRLTSRVVIANFYTFNGLVECSIDSSWDTLTDTCTLSFPRKITWEKTLREYVKRGDKVQIFLGYNDNNKLAFEGYVRSVNSQIPVVIELEDNAYLLKKGNLTFSYQNATLQDILNEIVPSNIPIAAQPDRLGLGPFRISNMTTARVLEEIKKNYFQQFWFRSGALYAGLAYWPETQVEHSFHFQKNVISHDLEYIYEEDVQIKLKVISVDSRNVKTEFEYGDPEGEQRTIYYYNTSKADIDKIALQEIERMKYTGYRGSFETFGEPYVNHGDVVAIEDNDYPERTGRYLVKSVSRNFGSGGYRQEIELDTRA